MKTNIQKIFTVIFLMICLQGFSHTTLETNQSEELETKALSTTGNLVTVQIESPGVANNIFNDDILRKAKVYLPPDYSENKDAHYPVLYLLPWEGTAYNSWFIPYNGKKLSNIMDNLIRSGRINPLIVVSPDCRNKAGGCWFGNSESGNWEDFVVNDVVRYMDENFRTLPFAVSRGIAGHSMGGYGALKLATKHPDVFSAVYSMNALVDFETFITDTVIWSKSFDVARNASGFGNGDDFANKLIQMAVAFSPDKNNPPHFGNLPKDENNVVVEKTAEQWLENDPLKMIPDYKNNLMQLKAIEIDCSNSDACIMLNSNYSVALRKNGIANNFRFYAGNDNNLLMKRMQQHALPMFSANLEPALLQLNSKSCYTATEKIKAWLITDGTIYIVPNETDGDIESVKTNKIKAVETTANNLQEIALDGLKKGVYKIVGVSSSGFMSEPIVFGVNGSDTPEITICVTCSKTGKKLDCCKVTVDGEVCVSGGSDYMFKGTGKKSIRIENENYFTLEKSAEIYTDTVLNFSIVKDSYLQVVEKGYGKPVFEATVTQNNYATLTDRHGFTTVQNLRDGMLDCRIFKPGYFTEVVHKELAPGESATIELTRKKAEVNFVLYDKAGAKISTASVKLGDILKQANQYGNVFFDAVDARQEYRYAIISGEYKSVEGSFFLEADTTIAVQLQTAQDITTAENVDAKTDAESLMQKTVTGLNNLREKQVKIYPNPVNDILTIKTDSYQNNRIEIKDISGKTIYNSEFNGDSHQINVASLKSGLYLLTVKTDDYVTVRKILKK